MEGTRLRDFKSVEIPERMKHLPLDRRGYPVPVNVLLDKDGRPHFTINDEHKRQEHLRLHQCPICGGKLLRGRWSLGGPGSAFHDDGAYIDPPMHYECYRYAMQVCPYLAMPSFTKRLDARTVDTSKLSQPTLFFDTTILADRPPVFVAVMHIGEDYRRDVFGRIETIRPKRPYRNVEFWAEGRQLSDEEGRALTVRYFEEKGEAILEATLNHQGPKIIAPGR